MPRIMPWKSVSTARRSRSESDEQPKASTTHSIPLIRASPLSLGLPAFRAEFTGARNGLAALATEFRAGRGRARSSGARCCRCRATAARTGSGRLFHSVHHRLAHGDARAKPGAYANGPSALIPGSNRDRLGHLILREFAHVPENVHADALVEHFLKLFGKRKILDDESIERQAVVRERGLKLLADFFCNRALAGGHIEKRHLAAGKRVGRFHYDPVKQLGFEISHMVEVARAADFRVERLRIVNVVGINSETAQTNSTELLVADGDGILCAPVLVGLNA